MASSGNLQPAPYVGEDAAAMDGNGVKLFGGTAMEQDTKRDLNDEQG